MKCLLVDANWQKVEVGPRLALGCLASAIADLVEVEGMEFLLEEGELAAIAETPARFWLLEQKFLLSITEKVRRDPAVRVVGISGWSGSFPRMLRIAHCCKTANPDVMVVMGGSHVTLYERSCSRTQSILRRHRCVDRLVVGDGETPLRQLIQGLQRASPRSRKERRLGRCHDGYDAWSPREYSQPQYTRPAWGPFLKSPPDSSRLVFFVEAGRGCPHNCRFCDERDMWRRYRWFDPFDVVSAMERGIERFESRSFRFADSTFTASPSLRSVCEEIVRRNLSVAWSCFGHCAEISEEKTALMAEAGCRYMLVGVESGVQSVLDAMRKGTSTRKIRGAVQALRKHGILVRGSFIIGYPGETTEQARATIDFAKSLELDAYAWHVYQPPFRLLREGHGINQTDFEHYELDCPLELTFQVLAREPSLLRDMHALPRLVALDPSVEPDPQRWPTGSIRVLSLLREALAATGSASSPHDLESLAAIERERRSSAGQEAHRVDAGELSRTAG